MPPKPDVRVVRRWHPNAEDPYVYGIWLRSTLIEAGVEDHDDLYRTTGDPKPDLKFDSQAEADGWIAAVNRDKR